MSIRPMPRCLLIALLSIGVAALVACQPRDGARAATADAPSSNPPTPAAADSSATPPKPSSSSAAAATPGSSPELKGLDPSPALSRTAMGNGLVIEELRIGTGEIVWPGSNVRTNIRGWSVATGEVYWDTATQGGPKDIALTTKAMKGMKEGVPGMRVGGKRRLTIPADMAYGFKTPKNERGEVVVPQATPIVLEIEVTEVLSTVKAAPAGSAAEQPKAQQPTQAPTAPK